MPSTNQQKPLLSRDGIRRAMNARRHRRIRIVRGDAPQISNSKGVRLRSWQRRIVQVVKVIVEPLSETFVITAAIDPQQLRTRLRDVRTTDGLFIQQAFRRSPMIGAEPGVSLRRRT